MRRHVVTRYLELLAPGQLRPTRHAFVKAQVARAQIPCAELHEYLYASIGRPSGVSTNRLPASIDSAAAPRLIVILISIAVTSCPSRELVVACA